MSLEVRILSRLPDFMYDSLEEMLIEDNRRMREAGCREPNFYISCKCGGGGGFRPRLETFR